MGTQLYAKYFDLPFVLSLRREEEFWTHIEAFEASENPAKHVPSYLKFLSEKFAERLYNFDKKLVKKTKAEIIIYDSNWTRIGADIGVLGAGMGGGLGIMDLAVLYHFVGLLHGTFRLIIRQLFDRSEVDSPHFKSYIVRLEEAGRRFYKNVERG